MDRREEALTRPLFATVAYAETFGLGTIDLPEWQTALLTRSIPGTEWFDALGCNPLTVFGPEPDLQAGRERLRAAGLDTFSKTRSDFERVARAYRASLSQGSKAQLQPETGRSWIAATSVAALPERMATAVGYALNERRIGSRRWWGGGLHRHEAFAHLPRHETKHSEYLADSTIGLPCYRDLPNETIADMCAALRSVCD